MSRPQGYSAAGRIRSIEKSNDLIGNWTSDLPACSIVPQLTTLPRVQIFNGPKHVSEKENFLYIFIYVIIVFFPKSWNWGFKPNKSVTSSFYITFNRSQNIAIFNSTSVKPLLLYHLPCFLHTERTSSIACSKDRCHMPYANSATQETSLVSLSYLFFFSTTSLHNNPSTLRLM
jgi:hypothetical protein